VTVKRLAGGRYYIATGIVFALHKIVCMHAAASSRQLLRAARSEAGEVGHALVSAQHGAQKLVYLIFLSND
jgi:hypothetical protein